MKQKWIIANWKMNGTAEQVRMASDAWQSVASSANVIFCPPVGFAHVVKVTAPHFYLGGQTCHSAAFGPYTGHTSAAMLKELGCRYVLVGHSEQRPCDVRGALIAVHEQGLIPIWCVGHRVSIPSVFDYIEECEHLARTIDLEKPPFSEYILAYEPLAAIGTGKPMDPDVVKVIVEHLQRLCGVPVLYGGSVNATNVDSFLAVSDGVLMGGMSLDVLAMQEILRRSI